MIEALKARARRDVDEGLLPSCQIALARDGELLVDETYGAAPESRYVTFSVTKAFTANWSGYTDKGTPPVAAELIHPPGDPTKVQGSFVNNLPVRSLQDVTLFYAGTAMVLARLIARRHLRAHDEAASAAAVPPPRTRSSAVPSPRTTAPTSTTARRTKATRATPKPTPARQSGKPA